MSQIEVVIVGGGLAGLSCAFELVRRGRRVMVLEAKSILGGRTASWVDAGMPVESGLHKFLGIYRALPQLLEEAGVKTDEMLTWVDELAFLDPAGPNARFAVAPFHHPVSTAKTALLNTDFLPTAEKAKLAAMAAAGTARATADPLKLDELSIAQYAAEWGVSDDVIRRVISTSTQAVLFLPAHRFSAYAAFGPVLEGLKHGMTMRIGAFNGGMTEVMMQPIARAVVDGGGTIREGAAISGLLVENGQVKGVRLAGKELRAGHVVLATSLKSAQDLLRTPFGGHEWFQPMLAMPSLSAATIQFELDQPLIDSDRTNFSPTSLCCFAEQSRTTFRHLDGRFSAILYPPDDFIRFPEHKILELVYADADALGLPLREHVVRHRIVNHPHDFYAMQPGTEKMRPAQATPVLGLSLAGDYTSQAFSASMEGAVISGQLAAEAVPDEQ
jgi:15-cis-phytoene desaturase